MSITLPVRFEEKMKALLKEEYTEYLSSFDTSGYSCIRINTNKISVERFQQIFPYALRPVPWCKEAFYVDNKTEVSKHPFYYAGLYYIQEPSAALPAEVLPVKQGDKVLDLCAAPGGKSVRLLTKLNNTGVLVSNDISSSRCQALTKNLEKFGARNAIVTCGSSKDIAPVFQEYFDCILVDAPCSGEGMFRKEKELIKAYEKRDSSYYVPLQQQILMDAVGMLKQGGYIVYSTCTFSKEEDEEIIQYALGQNTDLHVLPVPYCEGFVQNDFGTKLFPHKIQGEGHFTCLLQKGNTQPVTEEPHTLLQYDLGPIHYEQTDAVLYEKKEHLYAMPVVDRDISSLRLMRSGVLLGETVKGRFKPNGAFALTLKESMCTNCLKLHVEDPRVLKYLKGETIQVNEKIEDGIVLVMLEDYPLGFATYTHGVFKNGYPKGWIYR